MSSTTLRATSIAPSLQPADLWHKLKTIDVAILDHLAYLSRLTAQKSRTGAHYATPGRAWLARKVGVSIRTITRHTTALVNLGLITKRERRRDLGKWQTNLYCLVGRGGWLVARTLQGMRRPPHGETKMAHKPPSEGEDGARPDGRKALRALLNHLTEKIGRG